MEQLWKAIVYASVVTMITIQNWSDQRKSKRQCSGANQLMRYVQLLQLLPQWTCDDTTPTKIMIGL